MKSSRINKSFESINDMNISRVINDINISRVEIMTIFNDTI